MLVVTKVQVKHQNFIFVICNQINNSNILGNCYNYKRKVLKNKEQMTKYLYEIQKNVKILGSKLCTNGTNTKECLQIVCFQSRQQLNKRLLGCGYTVPSCGFTERVVDILSILAKKDI